MRVWFFIGLLLVVAMRSIAQTFFPIQIANNNTKPRQVITTTTPAQQPLRPPIAADFYAQHIGFFCKQELNLQQKHLPATFRLGSMDYCNFLEQKPGYKYINTTH